MSSYAPAWVKRDRQRFPRAELSGGKPIESLSAFSQANLDADRRAFAALMRQLRVLDGKARTVVMVQVENEVGLVNEPMDRSALAKKAWSDPVPAALVAHLASRRESLAPEVATAWRKAGGQLSGTWQNLFGNSPAAEELFTAWHYARYVDEVAKAGKAEYALAMYVNAALNRPGHRPGQYPSGGPVPHLIGVWKVAAPTIDLIAPDVYFGRLDEWTAFYQRRDNALFVPEIKNDEAVAVHALFAFGQGAIGFSPFTIEATEGKPASELARVYGWLRALGPSAAPAWVSCWTASTRRERWCWANTPCRSATTTPSRGRHWPTRMRPGRRRGA